MYGVPRLIVLDEPNASLDKVGEQALLASISQLKQQGCTIVMVTHKPELLSGSDYLLFLQNGQIELFDRTQTILQDGQGKNKATTGRNSWGSGMSYGVAPIRTASQKS